MNRKVSPNTHFGKTASWPSPTRTCAGFSWPQWLPPAVPAMASSRLSSSLSHSRSRHGTDHSGLGVHRYDDRKYSWTDARRQAGGPLAPTESSPGSLRLAALTTVLFPWVSGNLFSTSAAALILGVSAFGTHPILQTMVVQVTDDRIRDMGFAWFYSPPPLWRVLFGRRR